MQLVLATMKGSITLQPVKADGDDIVFIEILENDKRLSLFSPETLFDFLKEVYYNHRDSNFQDGGRRRKIMLKPEDSTT